MRRRPLPTVDDSLAALAEHGVDDAPRRAPDPEGLRALLDMAAFVAEHRKRVSFPAFTWEDPAFVSEDAKVTLRFAYARFERDVATTIAANLARVRDRRTLLAIDAHRADIREYALGHELYGQVTLFAWPTKPPEPADPRIATAMERGWAATLKEHNLVPGRGIVVLDEHQGLLLRDERLRALVGLQVLLPDGHTKLWWNPFADDANSELQYWLKWGAGTGPSSAWREQFFAEREE